MAKVRWNIIMRLRRNRQRRRGVTSQGELAFRTGICQATISKMIAGRTPILRNRRKIAGAMNMSIGECFPEVKNHTNKPIERESRGTKCASGSIGTESGTTSSSIIT